MPPVPTEHLTLVPCHDPALDMRSRELDPQEIMQPAMQKFFDAMLTLARGEQGDAQKHVLVGLAAPQVGSNVRVILVDVKADGKGQVADLRVYINPVIVDSSGDTEEWYEACYSTGNVKGVVSRPCRVTLTALDRLGHELRETHIGYVARIFSHEIDHLDGVRFPERVDSRQRLHIVKSEEMVQYRNEDGWRNWSRTISQPEWREHV